MRCDTSEFYRGYASALAMIGKCIRLDREQADAVLAMIHHAYQVKNAMECLDADIEQAQTSQAISNDTTDTSQATEAI